MHPADIPLRRARPDDALCLGAAQALPPRRAGAELRRFDAQAPFAGIGVGRRLSREAEALAAARGAQALWLTSWIGNARALAFYPREGHAAIGTTAYRFEGESHENRLFAKELVA